MDSQQANIDIVITFDDSLYSFVFAALCILSVISFTSVNKNLKMYQVGSRKNPFNDYEQHSPRNPLPQSIPSASSPRNPSDSYYFTSQAPKPKKQFGMFSRRYLPKQHPSASRSRITQQNMSASGWGLGVQQKLYSEQMVFLLSEEEGNLKYFKEKIQAEKQRALRDFDHLKQQIGHLIQDLQVSVLAELDLVYKDFLTRYKQFKQHMVNLKEIRRSLMNQLPPTDNDYLTQLNQAKGSLSNRDLLGEIEKDAQLFRTQKLYNQIADLQRENVVPAKELASQIILMGGIQTQFYEEKSTGEALRGLVQGFGREVKGIYPQIRDKMVLSAQLIIGQGGKNSDDILNGLSQYQNNEEERLNFKSADHRDIIKSFRDNSIRRPDSKPVYQQPNTDRDKKYVRPVSSSSDFQAVGSLAKQSKATKEEDTRRVGSSGRNYHMGGLKGQGNGAFKVGVEQQNVFAEWAQDINLREVGIVDAHQNSQAMLCGVFACEGKVIVVGGKDKVLRVYEVSSGKLLYVLSGHQANICSLASHGQFVSSGGDHGCSTLIVWDSKSWTVRSKVQLHSAAVTCIVDLQDSTNLATASYDRKINIFSYRKGTVLLAVNSCKAGIACMALSSDKHRLISSALDNSIAIWKITREGTNITNLELQRQFMNDSLVCSLRPFALKSNYFMVGTKDGRIQIINCLTGQTLRKLSVATTPVVELVLFERQNKCDSPIVVSCAPKQKSLVVTKTETGVNSLIDVKGRLNVDIGCGIGPKVVVSEAGVMAIVSQSPMSKQIMLYQVALL